MWCNMMCCFRAVVAAAISGTLKLPPPRQLSWILEAPHFSSLSVVAPMPRELTVQECTRYFEKPVERDRERERERERVHNTSKN